MVLGIQHLVNAQTEINRAVWAANLTDLRHSSFTTEKGRTESTDWHISEAIKDLEKYKAAPQESQESQQSHTTTRRGAFGACYKAVTDPETRENIEKPQKG